jgi:hypothetical protein
LRPQQDLAVDPVGLGAPRPLIHRDAGRVEYVVLDPSRRQQSVQPESVVAGLVTAHHLRRAAQLGRSPAPHLVDERQQLCRHPGLQFCSA